MYVIGLTGGVGSGKTVAAHQLAKITKAELLIADELGHLVMQKGKKGYRQIIDVFGEKVLDKQGEIDRNQLSSIVFSNAEALRQLNGIIHPAVKEYITEYIAARKGQKGLLILETALMFETGCDTLCDEIWYIHVPPEIRKERLKKHRGYSSEKSESIMKRQLQEEAFLNRCPKVIENDKSIEELVNKLICFIQQTKL